MFSPRRILGLESLRRRVADEMVVRVWKEMEEIGVVEVRGILQEGSFSNILESVFGSINNFNCLSLRGSEELGSMVKEGYELIAKFNLEDYFPFKFLDFYGVKRKCHKLSTKVTSVVGQMVEERKRAQELLIGENDFLSTLLSLPKEERLGDSDMVAILWVSF
ncbi:cytochrome P450 78A5-like [Trifolium medium]|nr:cytochrome P450 78A5-like [Trifolium medium]MCI09694.1 cytochrome P450 78A5-like [Trifolium medium]MCI09744.1 cytochrome P450 78A5-like [Trifolium medium]